MLGGGLWRDQCEELWVELMEGLQGRSTLKCLVIELPEFMDKVFAVVHFSCNLNRGY